MLKTTDTISALIAISSMGVNDTPADTFLPIVERGSGL
jgi:hypothetical protein